MKNCIIAQSGGPTAVINASSVGIYERNIELNYFNKVYFGLNGIEGILHKDIIDSSTLSKEDILNLKFTPSSGLGSCRYKLPSYKDGIDEYQAIIDIFTDLNIDTFFYIGGNDSMDTIYKLSNYCELHNIPIKFIGIPKTIDNDLNGTDHCPGFGSASKLISTLALETYLDSSVYRNNGVFILETMGRDTGWLAASSALATINGSCIVDLIYLPEIPFNKAKFIDDVKKVYDDKKHVFIVVSEGIRDVNGNFISEDNHSKIHDKFGHKQLGGACNVLKQLIVESNITNRVKVLELGVIQRCAMHCSSATDLREAWEVGAYGIDLSIRGLTGVMATINRISSSPYTYEVSHTDISYIANKTRYFPTEWINVDNNHIKKEAIDYLSPLIIGNVDLSYDFNLPKYSVIR